MPCARGDKENSGRSELSDGVGVASLLQYKSELI